MDNNFSYNDFITISESLLELYGISDAQLLKKTFLDDIGALIPYRQGLFYTMDFVDGQIRRDHGIFVNTEKKYQDIFFGNTDDEHNYLLSRYKSKHSNVFSESDIFEEKTFMQTSFYKTFMEPQNLLYSCGVILIKEERPIGVINLFRGREWGDFSDREKSILDLFKDHMANMVYSTAASNKVVSIINDQILTDREKEIVQLIVLGYTNEEISDSLCISLSTTKKHVYNIFNKYGVNSRMSLIRRVKGE